MADANGSPAGPDHLEAASRLILASGSPRRVELLARLGLAPEVRPARIDETPRDDEAPADLVVRLAASKAATVARELTDDAVVLAADTEVVLDGRTLGKPRDAAEAATMLQSLSGRSHEVITGIAVVRGGAQVTACVTTEVIFRRLSSDEVGWYVATGEPDDKAGAYGIQGAGAVLVERIDGSDTNVIGLPLPATVGLLRQVGFDPFARHR